MRENIPNEIRGLRQWCVAGENKIPLNPRTGQAASVIDPSTWGTFDEAISSGYIYIGIVLSGNDPYCVIDLDNKETDPVTEEEWKVHQKILSTFQHTYIEKSASGRGYHIVTKAKLDAGRRRGKTEVYSYSRFMIFTGDVVVNAPIEECQSLINMLVKEMPVSLAGVDLEQIDGELSDAEIDEMATNAANGDKYLALCNCTSATGTGTKHKVEGSYTELGYETQSEADFALLSILAYYTKDNEQVRRIFRYTGLGKRDKAKRDDYLNFALSKIRAHEPPPIDTSAIDAKIKSLREVIGEKQAEKDAKNEQVLKFPPGLVGEVADYFYSTAIRPVREIALVSAIAVCAGVCSRAFNISGTGLNQYIIMLARTGSGKEAAATAIDQLIAATRVNVPIVDDFMGPAAFSSGQALIRVLDETPCFVSVLGEVGITLQQISSPRANSAEQMLKKVLLDLYGKSGWKQTLRSTKYSDSEKNTKTVQAPNVTILGESVPERFYETLSSDMVAEGLIPRFTIVEYDGDRPPRNMAHGLPPEPALVSKFSDLIAVAMTATNNHTCIPVQMDSQANEICNKFDQYADNKMNGTKLDVEIQLWNRAHLKLLKLAALVAVGVNPHQPIINQEIARWAANFIHMEISGVAKRFSTGDIGDGEPKQLADLKRTISYYFERGEQYAIAGGSKSNLYRLHLIPYTFLCKKLYSMASFRNSKFGPIKALENSLSVLINSGELQKVPPKYLQDKCDGYLGDCYTVTPDWIEI